MSDACNCGNGVALYVYRGQRFCKRCKPRMDRLINAARAMIHQTVSRRSLALDDRDRQLRRADRARQRARDMKGRRRK